MLFLALLADDEVRQPAERVHRADNRCPDQLGAAELLTVGAGEIPQRDCLTGGVQRAEHTDRGALIGGHCVPGVLEGTEQIEV